MAKAKVKSLLGPPTDRPWIWLETDMLASPAWRGLSINARRLLDFLLIEHRAHAGRDNGNLKATHRQLADFGLRKSSIAAAIEEIEAAGFARASAGGYQGAGRLKRHATTFRLTFVAGSAASPLSPPTHEWKAIKRQKSAPQTGGNLPRKPGAELPRKPGAGENVIPLKNGRNACHINGLT